MIIVYQNFGVTAFHRAHNQALQPTAKSAAAERNVRFLKERRYLMLARHALKRERKEQYLKPGVVRLMAEKG